MIEAVVGEEWGGILVHLLVAWGIGSLIGLERSFHGRSAGFRTHALVCVSSTLLTLITTYQHLWLPAGIGHVQTDPTRMAQGIMTGIGFLGAGVILKEGLTVRGLTTAASIWITASIGVLVGVGFWWPALLTTVITLMTLATFRWVEGHMHRQRFVNASIKFPNHHIPDEDVLRAHIEKLGCRVVSMSYHMSHATQTFEYQMVVLTWSREALPTLSRQFRDMEHLVGFRLSPVGG